MLRPRDAATGRASTMKSAIRALLAALRAPLRWWAQTCLRTGFVALSLKSSHNQARPNRQKGHAPMPAQGIAIPLVWQTPEASWAVKIRPSGQSTTLQAAAPTANTLRKSQPFLSCTPKCCGSDSLKTKVSPFLGKSLTGSKADIARDVAPHLCQHRSRARIRAMFGTKRVHTLCRRLAAVACLLAYLVGGFGLAPEVLALAAWMEGSHTVAVGAGQDEVSIVLKHGYTRPAVAAAFAEQRAANQPHHHGLASRLVCLIGSAYSPRENDHVASFTIPSGCERRALHEDSLRVSKPVPLQIRCPRSYSFAAIFAPRAASVFASFSSSSPILATGTTVLLI